MVSDAVIIALIMATPPTIIGLATLRSANKVNKTIVELHTTMNSKMDAFLKLTAAASRAEGVLEGRGAAKAEASKKV